MTPERFRQVSEVFHAALGREVPVRTQFVDQACAGDAALRDEVLAMLDAHHAAGRFGRDPVALPLPDDRPVMAEGTPLGPYRIQAALGAGGMGEVYKAIDTRLDRTVAIKVLPRDVASDADSRRRFEHEARTVASLSHPHICPLFDVGEQDGQYFLVMEYLEGETLASRLASGALPVPLVTRYAVEIADALDKAHRRGIVHRDVKPGNIMLTSTGARLLDFGLAKLHPRRVAGVEGFSTVTATSPPLTGRGSLVGTIPYMAPEQLQGREADARTDIFAFGAVIYEMLTGARAFDAPTQAGLIGAILKDEVPPARERQPLAPPALDRAIQRCLAKDPEERWQSAADLRYELHRISTEPARETSAPAAVGRIDPRGRRMSLGWAAVGLAVGIAGTALLLMNLRDGSPGTGQTNKFSVTLPAGLRLPPRATMSVPLALSPDGQRLVFSAADADDNIRLYVRELNELEIRALPGTEGGAGPFFSPDGQWVGFAAGGALKKIPLAGGTAVTIGDNIVDDQFGGASWSTSDTIVFSPTRIAGLSSIPASGGIPRPVTTPDAQSSEVSHFLPQFLPGGHAVLYSVRSGLNTAPSRVEVVTLDSGERRVIAEAGISARYASTGHLIYGGDGLVAGSIWAVPFDTSTRRPAGQEVRVGDSLLAPGGLAYFALSGSGTLALVPKGGRDPEQLVWITSAGESTLADTPGNFNFPRLSPDGKRLAVTNQRGGDLRSGIWVLDLDRPHSPVLFSSQSNNDHLPVWTRDGTRLVFSSLRDGDKRNGPANLYWKRAGDPGEAERLTKSDHHQDPGSWSPDGQLLVFAEQHPQTIQDIWVLDMRDRTTRPFLRTPARERHPMISPDGRWLAYASGESGSEEVYVQAFPGGGQVQRISDKGGNEPLWAHDGTRLFYRRPDAVVAVSVTSGPTLVVGTADVLVQGAYDRAAGAGAPNYEVARDGRFLMVRRNEVTSTADTRIDIVVNWFTELAARLRTK